MRNRNIFNSGIRSKVYLDGFVVAYLMTGRYVTFLIPPGTHSIGADLATVSLEFGRGESYFFVISPGSMGMDFERISPNEGMRQVERYREVEQ